MNKITFSRKPMPVFPEHRIMYKITQILTVLYYSSRSYKSSIIRIQFFNWSLKSDSERNILLMASKKESISTPTWGFDPMVNTAIDFACQEGLLSLTSNMSIELTELGKTYLLKLEGDGVFQDEIAFLKQIGKKVTEKMVTEISEGWS